MAYDPELDKNINELPVATTLTGSELVEVIQDGVNKQTTAQYIANLFGGGGGGGITWAGTLGYIPMASAESGGNITTMVDSPQSYLNNLFSTTFTAQPSKPADWFLWLKGGATSTDYAVIDCYITDTGTGSGSVAIQTSNATASYINECFAGRTTARILSSKNTGESASFYTQDTGAAAVSATLSFAISVVGFAGGKVLTNDGSLNIVESVTTATELSYVSGATSPLQAQIDALVSGLSWKQAVRVATTTNGTLSTAYANGQTVDGVVLATGDRILLKNQSTATQNGIYVVNASGAPTRSTDMNQGSEFPSATTSVSEGTTNADTQWVCTNDSVTVGSTNVVFVSVGGTSYVGTTNRVTVTGNVIDIAATYVGQTSITTLGTIGTGVWNGTVISGQYGGTGVANTGFTMTYAGNVAFTGAFNPTFISTATASYTLPSATSTLLANSLGLAGGTTLIGGNTSTGSIIFQDTSNSTNSLNTNHFIWKMTTATGSLEENLRMGNATGGEMNLYSMGNTTQYWLRSTANVSYFNAASDLRLQCGINNLLVGTTTSVSLRQATTMFTAMNFTVCAGTATVVPFSFQGGTLKTTAVQFGMETSSEGQLFYSPAASQRNFVGMWGYVAKTANYTATVTDYTIDCTANSFTVTLPTAGASVTGVPAGRVYVIKNSGAGTITIATTSSQTIDGTTPPTIAAGGILVVQSTGSNWIIIGN